MLEFLMSVQGGPLSPIGQQSYLATNQIGQIGGINGYGHCLNWTGTKFYVLIGSVGNGSSPTTLKLFVYDISSNTWADLGTIPTEMGINIYWSIVAIDNDTLFASCRLDKAIYKISTGTWTVLPKIPTGTPAFNKYGIKTYLYGGKVYLVGPNATDSIATAAVYNPTNDTITALASSGSTCGTYAAVAFYKGKFYVFPSNNTVLQKVQIYDIASNTWTFGATPTFNATYRSPVVYNGLIYLFGGGIPSVGVTDQVLVYDPVKDMFTTAKKMLRTNDGSMTYIDSSIVTMWGGRALGSNNFYTNFLKYELGPENPAIAITGAQTSKSPGIAKYAGSMRSIGEKLYSFSGYTTGAVVIPTMEIYDTLTDTWISVTGANSPSGRYGYGSCVYDGKYYIFGGRNATTVFDDIYCYDPITNSWEAKGKLPALRYYVTAVPYKNKIYLYGGYDGTNQTNQTLEYDPSTTTLTTKANGPINVHGHSAVSIGNKMFVIGGLAQGTATALVYAYNMDANAWESAPSLPAASYYSGTTVYDNKIYRVGGASVTGSVINTSLVFNPQTGQWTSLTAWPVARSLLGMASTQDGVWVYGGYTGSNAAAEMTLLT